MLNHGLEWDKWVLTNLSHSIDRGLTQLFLGRNRKSHAWLHTRGVATRLAALNLYHSRRNDRDLRQGARVRPRNRDLHGNGDDGNPADSAGFPREWKQMLRESCGNGNIILRDSRGNVCSFLPCDAMRCTVFVIVILSVCLSVCPSVCHTRGLCPHGSTYDHDFFTIW